MKLTTDKTKIMIFNYTTNHQFSTRVTLDKVNIEVVEETKLLGTHITNDLKWDVNTRNIIKKSNARMQLLRKIASFGASQDDMTHIYTLLVRSALEFSSSVWHTSLTTENETDHERVQKSAFRLILGNEYFSYQNAQNVLGMETLKDRRESLIRKLANKSLQVQQMPHILKENTKLHTMDTRNTERYQITYTNTDRFRKSAGVQMQYCLNAIN